MLSLPATPYEACEKITVRVTSLSLVRYRGKDYSVPTEYGHCQVLVKGFVHEVVITCASDVIARHPRSYEREAVVFDPLHYLALLEQKTRALDQAASPASWKLPECFSELRRLLEARLKKPRVDRDPRLGTADRSLARPPHPPRPHPGDERRQLPPQTKQPQTSPTFRTLTLPPNTQQPDCQLLA